MSTNSSPPKEKKVRILARERDKQQTRQTQTLRPALIIISRWRDHPQLQDSLALIAPSEFVCPAGRTQDEPDRTSADLWRRQTLLSSRRSCFRIEFVSSREVCCSAGSSLDPARSFSLSLGRASSLSGQGPGWPTCRQVVQESASSLAGTCSRVQLEYPRNKNKNKKRGPHTRRAANRGQLQLSQRRPTRDGKGKLRANFN